MMINPMTIGTDWTRGYIATLQLLQHKMQVHELAQFKLISNYRFRATTCL